jgi:hypothetical protein
MLVSARLNEFSASTSLFIRYSRSSYPRITLEFPASRGPSVDSRARSQGMTRLRGVARTLRRIYS